MILHAEEIALGGVSSELEHDQSMVRGGVGRAGGRGLHEVEAPGRIDENAIEAHQRWGAALVRPGEQLIVNRDVIQAVLSDPGVELPHGIPTNPTL